MIFLNNHAIRMLAIACAVTVLGACAGGVDPLSAARGAVEHAVEDRSTDDATTDLEIRATIAARITDEMGTDIVSISSDVYEQRVMLTGIVETDAQKSQAGAIARGVEDVRVVYNELRVVPKTERDKGAVEGFVDDTVVETKIDGLLIDASGVSSRNYRWRSVHGHVYLIGRALSESELQRVFTVIRGIEGVASLTSHVEVRPL